MPTPSDPDGEIDPYPFADSPYPTDAPRERAPQPPAYPYGQPQRQWDVPSYRQDGANDNGPWLGQGQNTGYPEAGQSWEAFPSYSSPGYPHEGYMGEISQPPYLDQVNGIQPWTIPAAGPMLSSRSWPDISLDTLEPFYRALPLLARPLPRWLLSIASIGVVGLLAALVLTGPDWAAGAFRAGLAAGALAVGVLAITAIRSLGGLAAHTNDRRQVQYTGAVLVMVILLVFSGSGIGLQAPIHHAQASTLTNSQQWQRAIDELRLAGETPPASEALAQVYNTWGEYLRDGQRYDEAIGKFTLVLNTYKATSQGVRRAQVDSTATYITWGQQATQSEDYRGATQHFDALLKQTYCLSACQNQVSSLDATAYYHWGETALSTQDYADAASAFGALTTRFATATEAQQIHADYANALLGWGKQQLGSSTCTAAVPTYQKLADGFADTSPGQAALAALQAPQPVLGQLTTADPSLKIQAILATNLQINPGMNSPTIASFATVAMTPLTSTGTFQFAPVPQGHYPLLWQFSAGGKLQTITFINTDGSNTPAIVANVGPLCPYNFGAITQSLGS